MLIVREASTLKIPPGYIPEQITVEGKPFRFYRTIEENEEIIGWEYHRIPLDNKNILDLGLHDELHILND